MTEPEKRMTTTNQELAQQAVCVKCGCIQSGDGVIPCSPDCNHRCVFPQEATEQEHLRRGCDAPEVQKDQDLEGDAGPGKDAVEVSKVIQASDARQGVITVGDAIRLLDSAKRNAVNAFSQQVYSAGVCCSNCLKFNVGFESDRILHPFICPITGGQCPAHDPVAIALASKPDTKTDASSATRDVPQGGPAALNSNSDTTPPR